MNVLIVHQNFPGQFKHLAPRLANRGDRVVAMTMNVAPAFEGIEVHNAAPTIGTNTQLPWAQDFETKLLRAESAYRKAREIKAGGFEPDVIVGHMGWGDMLFLKDVWPQARLGVYCEYFYGHENSDATFDAEFPMPGDALDQAIRLKLKTLPQRMHFDMANSGLSPTQFQADTYPLPFRDKITVVHDGIDTKALTPPANPQIRLSDGRTFGKGDEIVTFVSRNLEPYRGYHIFMRSLPRLMEERPEAKIFIIGKDGNGYGANAPHSSWKQIFLDEVKDRIDLSRLFFTGAVDYQTFLTLLSLTRMHVYLTYPFVLSWSLMEAMALEAPILASATGPVMEVIEDGKNGLLFDFFDPQALAEKGSALLASEELRRELGQNARRTVIERYDLETRCLPAQIAWVDALAQSDPKAPFFEN